MKRAIILSLLVIACIAGFLVIKGTLPFMPIYGSSMEPTLHSGALMFIKPVDAKKLNVGDIIVYNVPKPIQDYYNYPKVVSHRVVQVVTSPAFGFRTKGDNTGEDPFTVRPGDIRGTVGTQVPFLGLPLLFMQSKQGLIFVIIGLALLAIFLYGGDLLRGGNFLHRGLFSPVIAEEKRTNRVLTRKIEASEKKMESTEQALEKFSTAIAEYAQNLASHTSAVKSLAEASHELKQGAAEQNRVLMTLMQSVNKDNFPFETPEVPKPQEVKEVKAPPHYQAAAQKVKTPESPVKAKPAHLPGELPGKTVKSDHKPVQVPGCARSRRENVAGEVVAEKEIPSVLNKVHKKLNRKS